MSKQDLTQYGSQELLNWFLNDEGLYRDLLSNNLQRIKETANCVFIYSGEQWDEVIEYVQEQEMEALED